MTIRLGTAYTGTILTPVGEIAIGVNQGKLEPTLPIEALPIDSHLTGVVKNGRDRPSYRDGKKKEAESTKCKANHAVHDCTNILACQIKEREGTQAIPLHLTHLAFTFLHLRAKQRWKR